MRKKNSRSKQAFRRTALTRAIKGAMKAGVEIASAEIEPSGKIVIVFGKSVASVGETVTGNPWDEVLNHDNRH